MRLDRCVGANGHVFLCLHERAPEGTITIRTAIAIDGLCAMMPGRNKCGTPLSQRSGSPIVTSQTLTEC